MDLVFYVDIGKAQLLQLNGAIIVVKIQLLVGGLEFLSQKCLGYKCTNIASFSNSKPPTHFVFFMNLAG